jgi:hypothetical protein
MAAHQGWAVMPPSVLAEAPKIDLRGTGARRWAVKNGVAEEGVLTYGSTGVGKQQLILMMLGPSSSSLVTA